MTLSSVNTTLLVEHRRFPLLVRPNRALSLTEFARDDPKKVTDLLLEHGALLLRGFREWETTFSQFIDIISSDRLSYIYRSTPRKTVAEKIYTATIYPPNQHIPFHCENSYQDDWPMLIAFCCVTPAQQGGATPLADVVRLTKSLPVELVAEFRARRVRYTRYYRIGTDLSWQDVFQTPDPQVVGEFCRAHGIEHQWHPAGELSTAQVCQGTAVHPVLKSEVWFNQANLFHPSGHGEEMHRMLVEMFGMDRLPRNAHFGDGGTLDERSLGIVNTTFAREAVAFEWQMGDVLLLDNMQVAHARSSFTGTRLVLVAMSNSYSDLVRRLKPTSCE